jgi:Zn-finger nucleic acid-binding protein
MCSVCGGYALTLALLRKRITSPTLTRIWRAAQERQGTPSRVCPLCDRRMIEVSSEVGEPPVLVDVCPLCSLIWFDPQEFEKLPALPQEPREEELPPEAQEALAMAKVEAIRGFQDAQAKIVMGIAAGVSLLRLLLFFFRP